MSVYTVTLKDEVTPAAESASSSVTGLASSFKGLSEGLGNVPGLIGTLGSKLGSVSGMLGTFGGGAESAAGSLGSLGAAAGPVGIAITAISIAAAATIGVVTGLVATLWSLGKAAVQVTQKKAALLATFDALTDGAGGATLKSLSALSKELPFTTGVLAGWAKGLAASGLRGDSITHGVKAIAAASALMGDETGEVAGNVTTLLEKLAGISQVGGTVKLDNKLIKQLSQIGLSVGDLEKGLGKSGKELANTGVAAGVMGDAIQDALIAKGKGPLAQLGLSWEKISEKIIGVKDLFGDLSSVTNPFMQAVKDLFGEFSKGSTNAEIAKSGVTSLFQALFPLATAGVRAVHIAFLEIEIAALHAAVAVQPLISKLGELWNAGGSTVALTALKGLGVLAALVGVAFVVAFAPIGIAIAAVGYALGVVAVMLGGAVAAVGEFGSALGTVLETIGEWGSAAFSAAGDFVTGLVNGITSGAGALYEAVKSLAGGAVDALKGALGINSPSTVMFEQGAYTAEGFTGGIDDGAGAAAAASASMADGAAKAAGGGRGGSRGGGIRIDKIELTINGAGGDILAVTEEAITRIFERINQNQGFGEAAA